MKKHISCFTNVFIVALLLLTLTRCTSLPLGPLSKIACGAEGRSDKEQERLEALKRVKYLGIVIGSPYLHDDTYFGECLEKALSPGFVRTPSQYARYVLFVYPEWQVKKRVRQEVGGVVPMTSSLGAVLGLQRYSFIPTRTVTRWHLSFKAKCLLVDTDKAEVLHSFKSKWKKVEVWSLFSSRKWTTREKYVRKGLAELASKVATTLHKCRWSR